jgi:hypothetical protein
VMTFSEMARMAGRPQTVSISLLLAKNQTDA